MKVKQVDKKGGIQQQLVICLLFVYNNTWYVYSLEYKALAKLELTESLC